MMTITMIMDNDEYDRDAGEDDVTDDDDDTDDDNDDG